MISALKGDGVEDLREALAARMPAGPWLYPEDQVSDAPLRMLAAEITREKIYDRLHEELPYRSTVETDQWQVRPDGSVRIEQTIFVERESQRSIVLGKGGQTIKAIGQAARHRDRRGRRDQGPPVPAREGPGELGRRPGPLPRDGSRIPARLSRSSARPTGRHGRCNAAQPRYSHRTHLAEPPSFPSNLRITVRLR